MTQNKKLMEQRVADGQCTRCGGSAPKGQRAHRGPEGCIAYLDIRLRGMTQKLAMREYPDTAERRDTWKRSIGHLSVAMLAVQCAYESMLSHCDTPDQDASDVLAGLWSTLDDAARRTIEAHSASLTCRD